MFLLIKNMTVNRNQTDLSLSFKDVVSSGKIRLKKEMFIEVIGNALFWVTKCPQRNKY